MQQVNEGGEEETMEVKLLLMRSSPFAMSCALALRKKGVIFEAVEEKLNAKSDLLLGSNPVHKQVPVLIHNGKPVSQSLVILEYIEEAWPPSDNTPSLLPGSAYDRSRARFWADFANKKFIDTGLKLMKRFGEEHATARKEIVEQFITMEEGMRAIGSVGPYFLGDKMSLADMALAPLVPWLTSFEALGELKFPGPEKCGRMHEWLNAMREDPDVVASVPAVDWLLEYTLNFREYIKEHYPGRSLDSRQTLPTKVHRDRVLNVKPYSTTTPNLTSPPTQSQGTNFATDSDSTNNDAEPSTSSSDRD